MFLIIWFSLFLSTYFIKHVNTIEILMKQYRNKAEIDSLTGLFRYGAFIERLEKTYKENNIFSLVMLDIDDLKKINDNYGHLVGNDAITYIARTLIDCIGLNGTIGRVGGDEFSIILPKYSSKEAHDLCDEIIKSLKTGQKEVFNNLEVEISVSMGISSFPQDSRDLSELINIADTLLYSSKKNGKNKVSHSDSNL